MTHCKCGLPVTEDNQVEKNGKPEHRDCVKAHRDALIRGDVAAGVLQGEVVGLTGAVKIKDYRPLCFGEAVPRVCAMIPCPVLAECTVERDRLLQIGLSPTPVKEHCADCNRDVLYPVAHAAHHRATGSIQEEERKEAERKGAA